MNVKLNVKLLAGLLAGALVIGLGFHLLRHSRVRRNATALLEQATRAEEQGRPDRALHLLGRYVLLAPADTDARARLGLLLDQHAKAPRQKQQVMAVFEQVLLRDPQRHDVRRRQAALGMELGDFATAFIHLEILHKAFPEEGELLLLLARCCEGKKRYEEAIKYFDQAITAFPASVEGYASLARLYRRRLGDKETADQWMSRLLERNPRSAPAYVGRASYVQEFEGSLVRAAGDVANALRLEPNNPEVLLLAGQLARDENRIEQARGYLERARRLDPRSPLTYQALADLELGTAASPGESPRRKAIAWLRLGLKELPGRVALLVSLVDLLLLEGEVKEGRELMAQLHKSGMNAPELSLLEAQALVQEGKWLEASHALEKVRPLLGGSTDAIVRADLLLGRCYQQLKDARQLAVFRRAAAQNSDNVQAALGVGMALLNSGRLEEAITEYERLMRLPGAPPAGWQALARILVLWNLKAPVARRDWDKVNAVLDKAAQATPDAVEVVLLRTEVLAAEAEVLADEAKAKKFAEANRLLEAACAKSPKKVELWVARAGLAEREGKGEEAFRILDVAEREVGDHVQLRLARARFARLVPEKKAAILASAVKGIDRFPDAERAALYRGLAEVQYVDGNVAEALRLGREAARLLAGEPGIRLFLFDLSLVLGDRATVDELVSDLRAIPGVGHLADYAEACALVWQARQGDLSVLEKVKELLTKVARRAESSSRVFLCRADVSELEGNFEEAIDNYQQALALGDRQVAVIERLVKLLYDRRRYAEAEEALAKLQARAPLSPELQKLAAEAALQKPDFDSARTIAQKAVQKDSKNYQDHVWLAKVLYVSQKPAEAEAALRHAIDLAKHAPEPRVALVQFYVARKQTPEALAAIEAARRDLPAAEAPLALAQCYESLGDLKRAEEQYVAAATARPDHPGTLRTVAEFYLRTNRPLVAVPHLRKLLTAKEKASQADVRWARRSLALGLAASGDYRQFQEALTLVGDRKEGAILPVEDQRVIAFVLSSHVAHRAEAIPAFEALAKRVPLRAEEHFRLAKLYEAEGKAAKARDARQTAVGFDPRNKVYLADYALDLLRRDRRSEATVVLERLRALEPWGVESVSLQARILVMDANEAASLADEQRRNEVVQGKMEGLNELLTTYSRHKDAVPAEATARQFVAAVILQELDREFTGIRRVIGDAAEVWYRRYVAATEEKQPESLLAFIAFLGQQGRPDEVLFHSEMALRRCAPERVATVSLAALRAAHAQPKHYQRAERWILRELGKKPGSSTLVEALAVVTEYQQRYQDAEVLYRKVLAVDPSNLVALNNLAYLLALQGSKPTEALGLVERALTRAGPVAELLDTRAVVHLARNQVREAVSDLDKALSQQALLPMIKFHLARAHHQAGDGGATVKAFQEAKKAGLEGEQLHPLERSVYVKLQEVVRGQDAR